MHTKTAGIQPFTVPSHRLPGELKRGLLIFDLIGIPRLTTLIESYGTYPPVSEDEEHFRNELEYLTGNGLLFDSWQGNSIMIKEGVDITAVAKEYDILTNILKQGSDLELRFEASARFSSMTLNNMQDGPEFESVPVIKKLILPGDLVAKKADVLNLVINEMPIPNLETPWEIILEFKQNLDNVGRFAAMRNWVNKVSRAEVPTSEIRDELNDLLYQYRKSLEIHHVKYDTGILETFIVGGLSFLEKTITLKWSEIARGIFSARQQRIDLLQTELTSPGRELAYIYKAHEKFVR
jgi:hypothetical protein